ncbi:hypothetical protein CLV93_102265 [Prolixibacter denitrificans]|jgi:hypothetical protein|uniref:Uncharacterized protein n=1 Tax=Prolixibacter denitrificans TaxID=1541063 RepID=A0A2P8CHM5_9BACT|nr:hypothetical protein CLV93_102265 [Prolixibacter denitrificans]
MSDLFLSERIPSIIEYDVANPAIIFLTIWSLIIQLMKSHQSIHNSVFIF